jgi:hypothetical protein
LIIIDWYAVTLMLIHMPPPCWCWLAWYDYCWLFVYFITLSPLIIDILMLIIIIDYWHYADIID